jgi:hypothetical protein
MPNTPRKGSAAKSTRKRRLDKGTLSQTFKFDTDRFLRFRLATQDEVEAVGFNEKKHTRVGINLIRAAGRRWETDKYDDLLGVLPSGAVHFKREPVEDELAERRLFAEVEDLFEILRRPVPPSAVFEASFDIPTSVTPALQEAYDEFGLDQVKSRPDILWIRRAGTGAPLVDASADRVEYEIHVIDVKMAAEPSLRHFTEVTYYALALAEALKQQGLADRYAVSKIGFIWPGSHDTHDFRKRFNEAVVDQAEDPLAAALGATLKPVPYEVYEIHVREFFRERLLPVLRQKPLEAAWHVSPTCALCDYLAFCAEQAEVDDHLSRIPWLTQGQADLLRRHGIVTTAQLAQGIRDDTPEWQAAVAESHQLRAERPALRARAAALHSGAVELAEGRKVAFMPAWTDMDIFLTVHFDMGSGITFALGASRVLRGPLLDRSQAGRDEMEAESGGAPWDASRSRRREDHVFVVDRVESMDASTERERLKEFLDVVNRWLEEAHHFNEDLTASRRATGERDSAFGKARVHFFVWDGLEVRQLKRMLQRHMKDSEVLSRMETLLRIFPPDRTLPDPEMYKSQPGTVVKDVFRVLIGLPIAHDYTLLDVANGFHPWVKPETNEPWTFRLPYGFVTELSDQIPFERAYELWSDRVVLKHFDKRRYTRGDVQKGIERAVATRLSALRHVVGALRTHYRDKLVLRKPPFTLAPATQLRAHERNRRLNALEQLDMAARDLENRALHALPVEEREARFHSIRGLRRVTGQRYSAHIEELRSRQERYLTASFHAFTFAPTSRDTRIREGEFNLALWNEVRPGGADLDPLDLHVPWRKQVDLDAGEATAMVVRKGLWNGLAHLPLRYLLEVELISLQATAEPPFLVLLFKDPVRMELAVELDLIDLDTTLVVDPLHNDFETEQIAKVLRAVGRPAPAGRRRGA